MHSNVALAKSVVGMCRVSPATSMNKIFAVKYKSLLKRLHCKYLQGKYCRIVSIPKIWNKIIFIVKKRTSLEGKKYSFML